jgi:peptidoglycan-associated lipoprotein
VNVNLNGFADDRGSVGFNQQLSELRATEVKNALVSLGVDAARISTAGFNEQQPIDPARTEEARAKNRRVEFGVAN